MIEADIILGTVGTNNTHIPIMGHPPANTSDISLKTFLEAILEHNKNHSNHTKGVKLDFKSIEVFNESLPLLIAQWHLVRILQKLSTKQLRNLIIFFFFFFNFKFSFPIWINADIISGPLNNTVTKPVDADEFLSGCKKLPNAILSIGWTTQWGSNFTDGNYTKDQVDNMVSAIRRNHPNIENHPITFPVRAGIAAQSEAILHELVATVKEMHPNKNVTLTIWSSPEDSIKIDSLRKLILSFGLDRVYLDVPKDVEKKLNLDNANAPGSASSIIHFGAINVVLFAISYYLNNYQF